MPSRVYAQVSNHNFCETLEILYACEGGETFSNARGSDPSSLV